MFQMDPADARDAGVSGTHSSNWAQLMLVMLLFGTFSKLGPADAHDAGV